MAHLTGLLVTLTGDCDGVSQRGVIPVAADGGPATYGLIAHGHNQGASLGHRFLRHDQDEGIYVIDGEIQFEVGDKRFGVGTGESVFIPRKVSHGWACVNGKPGKTINVSQPAGKMEEFFRELGKYNRKPYVHEVLSIDEIRRLFHDHRMDLLGPPVAGEWKSKKTDELHRPPNRGATAGTALHLLAGPISCSQP